MIVIETRIDEEEEVFYLENISRLLLKYVDSQQKVIDLHS